MKKSLSVAFLLVGSVIGAGFASGREILVFFAAYGYMCVPFILLCGFVIYVFSNILLLAGKQYGGDINQVNSALIGKLSVVVTVVVTLANVTFCAAMLSAVDIVGKQQYNINLPLFSVVAAALCCITVFRGIKSLQTLGNFLIPVMVIFIGYVCLKMLLGPSQQSAVLVFKPLRLATNSFLYVGVNLFTSSSTLFVAAKDMTKKQIKMGSFVAAVILTACLLFTALAILSSNDGILSSEMPMMFISQNISKYAGSLCAVILILAIITTLAVNMYAVYAYLHKLISNRFVCVVLMLCLCFLVKACGFSVIVDKLYKVLGVGGCAYVLILGVKLNSNKQTLTAFARRSKSMFDFLVDQ